MARGHHTHNTLILPEPLGGLDRNLWTSLCPEATPSSRQGLGRPCLSLLHWPLWGSPLPGLGPRSPVCSELPGPWLPLRVGGGWGLWWGTRGGSGPGLPPAPPTWAESWAPPAPGAPGAGVRASPAPRAGGGGLPRTAGDEVSVWQPRGRCDEQRAGTGAPPLWGDRTAWRWRGRGQESRGRRESGGDRDLGTLWGEQPEAPPGPRQHSRRATQGGRETADGQGGAQRDRRWVGSGSLK